MTSARSATPRALTHLLVLLLACALALAVPSTASAQAAETVGVLRADGLVDPLGLDNRTPDLSWQLAGPGVNVAQQAYQVRAASTREGLEQPDRWDSGRVESAASTGVRYGGPALGSREQVWWQVRVWTQGGAEPAWSAPARFEAGLLAAADWSAQWITDPPTQSNAVPVVFDVPAQSSRYVRIDVSRLGEPIKEGPPNPISRLQLAEIAVRSGAEPAVNLARGATVTSSEGIEAGNTWSRRFLTDGVLISQVDPKGYTSDFRDDPALGARPIWLQLALGAVRDFDQVLLYPRTDQNNPSGRAAGFPVDFTLGSGTAAAGPFTTIRTVTGQPAPPPYVDPGPQPLPVFAANFDVTKPVRAARLYATGLGVYAATVNGEPVSAAVLEPANTDFRDRVEYGVYDVTGLLTPGPNAVGVALGNGIFNNGPTPGRYQKLQSTSGRPRMLAQLEIVHTDGTRATVSSGPTWRTTPGGVTTSAWFGGEDFDARRIAPNWDTAGADRSTWPAAALSALPFSTTRLSARSAPPIEVVDEIPAVRITQPRPGVYVADLGINIAGWPQLAVTAPAGTTVTMRPSEILNGDGTVNQSTTGSPIFNRYTTAGTGEEVWHPEFSYTGFRYVQLEGLPAAPAPDDVTGLVLRAANAVAGSFTSSNEILNGVHRIIDRAVQGNMHSVLTDCPHREKLGWLEQAHLVLPTVMRNYDVQAYLRTLVQNIAEAQDANGFVPDTAPRYLVYNAADVNWSGAFVLTPLEAYKHYGDVKILQDHYPAMIRYVEFLQGRAGASNLIDGNFGDWRTFDRSTPTTLTGTFGYHQVVTGMAEIAQVLGRPADVARWNTLATTIGDAFNARYFNGTDTYATGSQAADAMALDMGVVPADRRQAVFDHLLASLEANGGRFTVGEIALPSLIAVLQENGREDVLYDLASSTENPSWGFQVVNGATALTEDWDGPRVGNSQNHFMLGAIDEWFSGGLAGIGQQPGSVAFRDLEISPAVVGGLTSAGATLQTAYGEVRSAWTHTGSQYRHEVTVPANSRATVSVPVQPGTVATGTGVNPVRTVGGISTFEVGSGSYVFTSRLAPSGGEPDVTEPVTTATVNPAAQPSGWWTSSPVSAVLSATDDEFGSGVASTSAASDGGEAAPVTGAVSIAGEGPHTLTYSSVDLAGNAEDPKTLEVRIDTVPPVVTAWGLPADGATVGGPVTATLATQDVTSGVASTEIRVDGGDWTAYSGPVRVAAPGLHSVSWRATDVAGNQSVPVVQQFTIASAAPTATVALSSTEPANEDGWYRTPVSATITAPAGVTAQYSLNGGSWVMVRGAVALNADRVHVLATRLLDSRQQVAQGSVSQVTVQIDRKVPTLTTSLPAGSAGSPRNPVIVEASGYDALSGARDVEYAVDGGPWAVVDPASQRFEVASVGQHAVAVRVFDLAGNVTTRQLSVTVNPDAAATVATPTATVDRGGFVTVNLTRFLRHEQVAVRLGETVLGSVTVDITGKGSVTLPVPADLTPGRYALTAAGAVSELTATSARQVTVR